MSENLNQEQEGLLIEDLKEKLDLDNHVVWGHGTLSQNDAEKILQEGIVVSNSYGLLEIAIPISSKDQGIDKNIQDIVNKSMHWPHREAKFVVLISVPNEFRKEQITEEIIADNQRRTRLPNRFITGYINAVEMEYSQNPDFQQNPEPAQGLIPDPPISRSSEIPIQIPTAPDPNQTNETVW